MASKGDRTRVRPVPERGIYDSGAVYEILDAGFVCHLGYTSEHGPVVLPTLYGRLNDTVYIHGSPAAGMFRNAKSPAVCLTVTRRWNCARAITVSPLNELPVSRHLRECRED